MLNHKIIKSIAVIAILFFILFPVKFHMIPISMNRLVGIFGMWCVAKFFTKYYSFSYFRRGVGLFLGLLFLAVCMSLLSRQFDGQFYMFLITPILNLCAGFLIFVLYKEMKLSLFCDLIIITQTIQAVLSFSMFISPQFADLVFSVIQLDDITASKLDENLIEYRLIGVGNAYFHAAATYGTTLLVLAILPSMGASLIYRNKVVYWLIVALMIVAGILSARTFMFVFITLFIFVWLVHRNLMKIFVKGIKVAAGLIFVIIVFFKILGNSISIERYEHMQKWAFELYEVYEETGELRTSSSDNVGAMYNIVPDNLSTWIIGDARFVEPGGYYKDTDIGYLRHIFYWGILGSIIYWLVIARYYKMTSELYNNSIMSKFFFVLFIWDAILNFKGIISMASFYVGPFLACGIAINHIGIEETNDSVCDITDLQCEESNK